MKKALILVLVGLIVLSAGCIKKEGSTIIIDLGNLTEILNNNQTTNQTTTPTPKPYIYEELVQVGGNLTIKELNLTIRPDYDPAKDRFFFITPGGLYWEPMNITVSDVKILGRGYFVGTTIYIANITIISPRELTITVNNPEG
ncbi:hypothetical protein PNA2_1314 [Pyrococcus sp. NA2]|uniref:hypothetical protein n=1 Tax=Pyrococcus sp. (strain NA2) TaxID=342949 RepID=UPI000209AD72|nr:hypothetical protein [Pyrococcus sp. NA2]AEC52229.1 hypothetical protein PNA2_1314 [Pyrococcus sp. NA2]